MPPVLEPPHTASDRNLTAVKHNLAQMPFKEAFFFFKTPIRFSSGLDFELPVL